MLKNYKLLFSIISFNYSLYVTISYMGGDIVPFDSGVYHFPMVNLIKNYFILIGSGNINTLYSTNSSFFYFVAIFEKIFFFIPSHYIIIPISYFLLQFYLFNNFLKFIKDKFLLFKWIYFLFLSIFLALNPLFILSISPDTISYSIGVFLVTEVLILNNIKRKNYLKFFFLFLILLTIKISNIFIGFIFFKYFYKKFKYINIRKLAILSGIILIPWIISNILISGFIIFPLLSLKIIPLSWSLSYEIGKSIANQVNAWARSPGQDYMNSLNYSFIVWIPKWFNFYRSTNIHGSVHIIKLYLLTFKLLPILIISNLIKINMCKVSTFLIISLLISNIFWLLSSPDPRFAYTSLIILPIYLLSNIISLIIILLNILSDKFKIIIFILIAFLLLNLPIYLVNPFKINYNFRDIPNPKGEYLILKSGIKVLRPYDTKCWASNDICSYYINNNLKHKKGILDLDIYYIEE